MTSTATRNTEDTTNLEVDELQRTVDGVDHLRHAIHQVCPIGVGHARSVRVFARWQRRCRRHVVALTEQRLGLPQNVQHVRLKNIGDGESRLVYTSDYLGNLMIGQGGLNKIGDGE